MASNIDTRVSPSLDPEVFRAVEGYDDETRPFVDGVVNAYNDIYQTLGKIHDARLLAEKNGAWTPENRVLIVSRESEKQKNRVLARLADAERTLRANIEHTDKQLSEPLMQRAGLGSLNGEVRAHAKALDRPKRSALIREALENDDGPTLEAILGAQPFLSGLTEVDHAHYLRRYHTMRQPHLVRRLDLMQRFLDMIERNTTIVHRQFEKATGAKPEAAAAIKQANDRAMQALKIAPAD